MAAPDDENRVVILGLTGAVTDECTLTRTSLRNLWTAKQYASIKG